MTSGAQENKIPEGKKFWFSYKLSIEKERKIYGSNHNPPLSFCCLPWQRHSVKGLGV